MIAPFNPDLDLEINRLLKAPVAKVWRCWTEPELVKQWFTPKPVVTRDVEIDLRPGGRFHTVMVMVDGSEHPGEGCFLDIEFERRLVWTDTLEAGFRPATSAMFGFTGCILMHPEDGGTRYIARAIHGKREVARQHEEMGFHEGWGTVAQQLEAFARTLA
ncbi:SRPBCC family protein [Tabrizicola sp. J26]|uniref:SRPBCC family protein n=1 Tax=Alitabrizicola rongguiensis TaxID=2909234 RepID=UPI001F1F4215|nr:SRPBCC family protein [Tabrizicola rongguiensis]MCF1707236.1 SRPBCC family protein [Tabrizicola rongguiensis]